MRPIDSSTYLQINPNCKYSCSAQSLVDAQDEIAQGKVDLRAEDRSKLLAFINWRLANEDVIIEDNFNETSIEGLLKTDRSLNNACIVTSYVRLALGQPIKEMNKHLFDIVEQEHLLGDVVKECQRIIMGSDYLREQCGKFDYDSFIDKAIRHLHSLNGGFGQGGIEELQKMILIAGRTQSGKSAVKGVIQSLAGMLNMPLIVLTKGVTESVDLHSKLKQLSVGELLHITSRF